MMLQNRHLQFSVTADGQEHRAREVNLPGSDVISTAELAIVTDRGSSASTLGDGVKVTHLQLR